MILVLLAFILILGAVAWLITELLNRILDLYLR